MSVSESWWVVSLYFLFLAFPFLELANELSVLVLSALTDLNFCNIMIVLGYGDVVVWVKLVIVNKISEQLILF